MAFAVLTTNTTLAASLNDLSSDPAGTHSFSFAPGNEAELYILDDDATFNDLTADGNQVVAPSSTIFTDNAPVAARYSFNVTPGNGDPVFKVYVVFENATGNNNSSDLNTLNYALVSETPMIAGVTYSVSNYDSDGSDPYAIFSNLLLCFAQGTLIETERGMRAIETLRPGDLVMTLDRGLQPVQWLRKTQHNWPRGPCDAAARKSDLGKTEAGKGKPVLFKAGALGQGLPQRDLIVSPQHRMLLTQGQAELLGPAIAMTGLSGVRQMRGCRRITYYHLMFERHEIIFAEGVPTESFYLGPWVRKSLSAREMARMLGRSGAETSRGADAPARPFLTACQTRALVEGCPEAARAPASRCLEAAAI